MSIHHHPGDQTLLRYASGSLAAGPALIVSAHVEGCAACRAACSSFEAVGGLLLEELPPTALAPDAFQRVIARLEGFGLQTQATPTAQPRPMIDGIALPRALAHCRIEPWRWFGPGIRMSRVAVPDAPTANVILLKARAGRRMPVHGHSDFEITQILHGSFSDGGATYGVGDVAEGDGEGDHRPVVGRESECITLAAIEGHLQLRGVLGRLIQPFIDI